MTNFNWLNVKKRIIGYPFCLSRFKGIPLGTFLAILSLNLRSFNLTYSMEEILLILLAYLIGSIPTAVWVSRLFFGFDIRDYGSGNSGATNTYRVLGAKWGTLVMIVDMLKAIVAVKLAFLLPGALKMQKRILKRINAAGYVLNYQQIYQLKNLILSLPISTGM